MEAAVRWSPHSAGDRHRFLLVDLTDQSLTLNQIISSKDPKDVQFSAVASYRRLPNFSAFDWSKTTESMIALGLVSGSACLLKLNEGGRSSETVATFRLRLQRKCNSIALSVHDWLAVALDRTRSDACLNIYDARDNDGSQEPIRRLCPAEVVSSVRFLPYKPEELIVAAQRAFIRLYDLRDGYSGSSSSAQVATRNVNNIAIDPLDDNYFASAGSTGDPTVTVWDRRWISQNTQSGHTSGAVFEFQPAVDDSSSATVWSLRYSGQQRGRLAICSSRGELKVVDMVHGDSTLLTHSDYLPSNPNGGLPWSHYRYVRHTRQVQQPYQDDPDSDSNQKLIAFDWMAASPIAPEQHILALRPNRKVDLLRVTRGVMQATVTARHDLSLASDNVSMLEPKLPSETYTSDTPYTYQQTAEDFGPYVHQGEALMNGEQDEEALRCSINSPQLASMISCSTIQRERCRRGYLFDCHRNMDIVSGNWQLERLWEIINRFGQQVADNGMVSDDQRLDLSYIGVAAVWTGRIGDNPNRKLAISSGKAEDAVLDIAAIKDLPPFDGERTNFPEHRQLALAMCGWKFTQETLEAECEELIDRGLYYQAIVQAVLHEYRHIALNLLRSLIRSKTVPNIGLGALLASDNINKEQEEMCNWMSADTDDPALKALLAFLGSGDWRTVMKTNYLHHGYRVALALKYLNDTELTGFIQSETARAVKNGDLEGILLTGLGEQSMDLFQTYITKTNDLQTAVLATAFTNPAYVDDVRWDMWKETYFEQMQRWRAFTQRSQFIVQHSQMARTKKGTSLLSPSISQVGLRCNHCQLSLAKYSGRERNQGANPPNAKGTIIISHNSGIVCPRCGRHMPRCGICKMWLGTPDPHRRGGAKELSRMDEAMAKFLTFCVNCEHGFHADHAKSWFQKHRVCPVTSCKCLCTVK